MAAAKLQLLRGYNLEHFEAWLKIAQQHKTHLPLPLQEYFIAESRQQFPDAVLDVFISYSQTDSDFARKLNDALQENRKTVWFDQESIAVGVDFQQEIKRGIENCDNFLFIISPNAIQSPYCADEVEYAHQLNKRIITILHRAVKPEKLHSGLKTIEWIDFNQHKGHFLTSEHWISIENMCVATRNGCCGQWNGRNKVKMLSSCWGRVNLRLLRDGCWKPNINSPLPIIC
ncbi:MAG TPA: toll/interleukin-1 receptor domain-containing protein, partial [Thioploca sp.]|nr:toll/interleukin-1 receptor domain-containing protein [Thioploca sp.]